MIVAFDTETCRFRPGCMAPELVCVTYQSPGQAAQIVHAREALSPLLTWLRDPDVVLVGQNVAYDMAVVVSQYDSLPFRRLVFDAYDADRVTDTQVRQWLLDTAAGCLRGRPDSKGQWIQYNYDLESLAKRAGGVVITKDAMRLSYGRLKDVPLERWAEHTRDVLQPEARARLDELNRGTTPLTKEEEKEADGLRAFIAADPSRCTTYALDDARATLRVYLAQERHAGPYLANQWDQARAYFAFHLFSARGLRADRESLAAYKSAIEAELADDEFWLKELGLVREDGSRDTKVAKARMIEACRRDKIPIPRTAAHGGCIKAERSDPTAPLADLCEEHVSLDSDACERSEDEILAAYSNVTTLKKVLSNDVAALEAAIEFPAHPRYGFAATGRTTCSKPNIQNQSKREGLREIWIPRPGKVFIQADYPSLELYTLAQCCMSWLGYSRLAEVLNAGGDPHLAMGAVMLKISYEEAVARKGAPEVKRARQLSKPVNFGRPGGMGWKRFIVSTRKQMGRKAFAELFGETEKEQEKSVRDIFDVWEKAWPEMPDYFKRVEAILDEDTGRGTFETLFTKRLRGGCSYSAGANNGFQALGSDIFKRAAWLLARACYVETESPLFDSRIVAGVHDEFIGETNDNPRTLHEAAYELAHVMAVGANQYLPDVPIPEKKIEPTAMRRWSKKAETRFDASGRLAVWMPEAA